MIILIIMMSIRNKDDAGGPISAGAVLSLNLMMILIIRISDDDGDDYL